MASTQIYEIRGIGVKFPYVAYAPQRDLMEKVISSLQTGQNALIESPTGTGKTLCLLCSVLAWRDALYAQKLLRKSLDGSTSAETGEKLPSFVPKHKIGMYKAKLDAVEGLVSAAPSADSLITAEVLPKIYYASRTHAQLSQVVSEVKKILPYYPVRTCVLGSREQSCINADVKKMTGNARTALCRQRMQKKTCEFHTNMEKAKESGELTEPPVADIEEIVSMGQMNGHCPYLWSREYQANADIILLPYNYLIDEQNRKAQNIDLQNAVIIFDEGHNLESSCSDAFSFELSHTQITGCIGEAVNCLDLLSQRFAFVEGCGPDDFSALRDVLIKFEATLQAIPLRGSELVREGSFIVQLFEAAGVTAGNCDTFIKTIDDGATILTQQAHRLGRQPKLLLKQFQSAIQLAFQSSGSVFGEQGNKGDSFRQYKLHIRQEISRDFNAANSLWSPAGGVKAGRTLSLWCFSAGVAMKSLMDGGVRSVILASGTLSPLQSFAAEMGIPFEWQIENPHVIQSQQIFVGVVCQGPVGCKLNSSYETRGSHQYISDLGNCISNFARIIPDGILVFFPSYSGMASCLEFWRKVSNETTSSVWDRITRFKEAFVEPKTKEEFGETINLFYKKIQNDKSGAIFFAVCRGKASEGIDFSDTKGRAVIVCGIPFPAAKDPKVLLKKQHLDDTIIAQKKENPATKVPVLAGAEWYKQQASRAVNQAIGRVIRHRNDFGAILLCDERFAQPSNINQLPVWIRPYVRVYRNFGETQSQLIRFFKSMDSFRGLTTEEDGHASSSRGHLSITEDDSFKDLAKCTDPKTINAPPARLTRTNTKEAVQIPAKHMKAFAHEVFDSMSQYRHNSSRTSRATPETYISKTEFSIHTNAQPKENNRGSVQLHDIRKRQNDRASSATGPPQQKRARDCSEDHSESRSSQPRSSNKIGQMGPADSNASHPHNNNETQASKRIKTESKSEQKSSSATLYNDMVKACLSTENYEKFRRLLKYFKDGKVEAKSLMKHLMVLFKSATATDDTRFAGKGTGCIPVDLMRGFQTFATKMGDSYSDALSALEREFGFG
ncbi:helicase C-terminal domain-containing protein [Cladochytrium replicatum]|nr:helicase C-terminal domain-containing protein [Cladochytrium replicatum]